VTNEEIKVNHYHRLSPLIPATQPFQGPLNRLKKGDCLIAFSRKDIFLWKTRIEKTTGIKCCMIYGSLPPEARTSQAALFNDPNNDYNVLIASDAIGMGLNLNIKRIIFTTLEKFDGSSVRTLNTSEIKQIAGRAGRFASVFPKGEVSCLSAKNMRILKEALETDVTPIEMAGLFPTYEMFELFYRIEKSSLRFSRLLDKFASLARLDNDHYFLCDYEDMKEVAKLLECIRDLDLRSRYTFVISPVDTNNRVAMSYLLHYAKQFSLGRKVKLSLKNSSRFRAKRKRESPNSLLEDLETLFHVCDLYLWLAMRFEGEFSDIDLATKTKNVITLEIQDLLKKKSSTTSKKSEPLPPKKEKKAELRFSEKKAFYCLCVVLISKFTRQIDFLMNHFRNE